MRESVSAVGSIEIEFADPERAADFFTSVWNLTEVERSDDSIYLRGTSAFHHILAVHPSHGPARVRRTVFTAPDRARVDALFAKISAVTGAVEQPAALDQVGAGYGFGFADPGGRAYAVVSDRDDHADDARVADRPYKIAHVNINVADIDATREFFIDAVGFRYVDHSGRLQFLNGDSADHSSLVICNSDRSTLNHVAFEMADLDSVMRGAGRMTDHGYPIEWGVGRHGPGDNTFAYFAGPEEAPLEYTADVLQIGDDYEFHGPEYWKWPPGRLDQWGVSPPHTTRWKRVQNLYRFAADAHRLHSS